MISESLFYDHIQTQYQEHLKSRTILEHIHRKLQFLELHRLDAVTMLLPVARKILDVGMGDGTLLINAHQRGYKHLYGIDISSQVVKNTIQQLESQNIKANLYCDDINMLKNLSSKKFDVITLVAVLEHVFDVHQTLISVSGLLKIGGTIILEVPNLAFLPRRLSILLGKLPKTGDGPDDYSIGHLHYFTIASLTTLLKQNHFEVDHVTSSGIASSLRNIMPTLLASNIIIRATKI